MTLTTGVMMNIVVIPEDFRKDQYILKPVFIKLLQRIGVSVADVWVCQDPLLGGIGEALKSERLAEIVERRRGWADIFILCVDRDGAAGRRQRLNQIEVEFQDRCVFFAENAWQEIETWALAGLALPNEWRWDDIRAEVDVKERYFEPLAANRGLSESLGGGRKQLGEEASRRIRTIRLKCPEDFNSLALRLENAV